MPRRTSVVYPPCDTAALSSLPLERAPTPTGGLMILSLAQFRPEKNHALQLRAFARFLRDAPGHQAKGSARVRLVVAGGCRDAADRARVEGLRTLCAELGLKEGDVQNSNSEDWDVCFRTNVPVEEMHSLLGQADVGIHTMRDEHFGISVVEFMAAGAVVLAHNSAGPALDIVTPLPDGRRTGFLADDEASYAAMLAEALLKLGPEDRLQITRAARESVRHRFAQEAFEEMISTRLITPLREGLTKKSN